MANWYCSSVDYANVAQYATVHVYAAGAIVRQLATPTVGNERCFRTAAGGTSGASEPTWTLTKGSTTTDSGGVVWVEVTGNQAYQAPGAWGAPHARLATAVSTGWITAGDTVYVAANHAETQASNISITVANFSAGLSNVICVDNSATGHVPPVAGDARTTATVTGTGSSTSMTISAYSAYFYGLTFTVGAGSTSGVTITLASLSASWVKYAACAFSINTSAGGSPAISIGGSSAYLEWDNVTVAFPGSSTAVAIDTTKCTFVWRNTPTALTGTAGAVLFVDAGQSTVLVDSVDFSAVEPTHLIAGAGAGSAWQFINCKVASGQSLYNGYPTAPGGTLDFISTDSAAAAYRQERQTYAAILTNQMQIVRTSGASDGTNPLAWQVVTSANAMWQRHFDSFTIGEWNPVTGANVTVTVCGMANLATLPDNDGIWLDANYLGNAGSPLGVFATETKADPLAANAALTADTSVWSSLVAARTNSHAYALGAAIAVSSNPNLVFFCTTAGTTAASLPSGYASAVDGGSVTDGTTAVFRAGMRFKMTVTLSAPQPQMVGYLRVVVKAALPSTTFFIDPLITLS